MFQPRIPVLLGEVRVHAIRTGLEYSNSEIPVFGTLFESVEFQGQVTAQALS